MRAAIAFGSHNDQGNEGGKEWSRTAGPAALSPPFTDLCTPGIGVILSGAHPVYETGSFEGLSTPMTIPMDQVLGEGNCGRATDRGKEAREGVRKQRRARHSRPVGCQRMALSSSRVMAAPGPLGTI